MNDKTTATWNIELMCECPHCEEYVNLLDYCDFWVDSSLDVCEWGTERSKNVEAICPECNEKFVVDLEY